MLECLIAVICIFILSPSYPTVFSRSMGCINLVRITENLAKTPLFIALLHTYSKKKDM